MKYGNILPETLDIEIYTTDGNYKPLRELISETVEEDIIDAISITSEDNGKLEIDTFTATTKTSIITLIRTPMGSYLHLMNRKNH